MITTNGVRIVTTHQHIKYQIMSTNKTIKHTIVPHGATILALLHKKKQEQNAIQIPDVLIQNDQFATAIDLGDKYSGPIQVGDEVCVPDYGTFRINCEDTSYVIIPEASIVAYKPVENK